MTGISKKKLPEFYCCHCRWLLLAFQREFSVADGLRLLDALMTHALELHSAVGRRARDALRQAHESLSGAFQIIP